MASLTQWTWVCSSLGDGEEPGSLACCSPWGQKSRTRLRDWTTTTNIYVDKYLPLIECLLCTKAFIIVFYLCNNLVFHMLLSFTVQHKMKIQTCGLLLSYLWRQNDWRAKGGFKPMSVLLLNPSSFSDNILRSLCKNI